MHIGLKHHEGMKSPNKAYPFLSLNYGLYLICFLNFFKLECSLREDAVYSASPRYIKYKARE